MMKYIDLAILLEILLLAIFPHSMVFMDRFARLTPAGTLL